ncbi:hypothetical protein BLNAU_6367 [Blattamonas nauphoetae]|uniref:Transmembrane protein n=1 Tax=Blattamonas nauphoetae TaxID=2049346 RepID=A0ABQ9Y4H6_9EUKA|nr:hypothetical protein BLNAU_6367 [Blattamonas nauphoetae]
MPPKRPGKPKTVSGPPKELLRRQEKPRPQKTIMAQSIFTESQWLHYVENTPQKINQKVVEEINYFSQHFQTIEQHIANINPSHGVERNVCIYSLILSAIGLILSIHRNKNFIYLSYYGAFVLLCQGLFNRSFEFFLFEHLFGMRPKAENYRIILQLLHFQQTIYSYLERNEQMQMQKKLREATKLLNKQKIQQQIETQTPPEDNTKPDQEETQTKQTSEKEDKNDSTESSDESSSSSSEPSPKTGAVNEKEEESSSPD